MFPGSNPQCTLATLTGRLTVQKRGSNEFAPSSWLGSERYNRRFHAGRIDDRNRNDLRAK
jgi:hypothetical protein